MAALKAERKAKMEQRRARMAAKKAGSTKRAYDNPEIQEEAARVFRDAFKKEGGDYAQRQRRKFLKDAQFKMDTGPSRPPRGERKKGGIPYKVLDTTDPATQDDLREGRTSANDYYKTDVTPNKPRNKPIGATVTPRNKPTPPTKLEEYQTRQKELLSGQRKKALEHRMAQDKKLEEYQTRQKELLSGQRKKALENMTAQNNKISDFFGSGSNEKKKGGRVKKSYKSGGKVRGSGCVTKGVRPCKMR